MITRFPIPMACPLNGALRTTTRRMPSFKFNPFDEDDVVFKASKIPWEAFHLSLHKDDPLASADTSQSTLSKDLAELARITIIGGKPKRVWPARPRHGVIGDHLVGQETSWPPRLVPILRKIEAPDTETNENAGTLIFAPRPIVPLGAVRAAFEVQATAGALAEAELTPLSATFSDKNVSYAVATQNDPDVDENAENAMEDPAKPAPDDRGNRQPLGVLYCDGKAIPSSNRVAPFIEGPPSPAISESGSDVSSGSGSAKGWMRLRPKAPPAIKIAPFSETCRMERMNGELSTGSGILKSAGSRVLTSTSNAPMMGAVPLPSVNTPSPVGVTDGN